MAVHAPVCSMEAEYDSIRAVKQFPFRLSRMATLLTRLKARAERDYTGGCPDEPRSPGETSDLSGNPALIWTPGSAELPPAALARLSACRRARSGNCMTFMVRQKGTELHVMPFRYLREHAPNDQFRRTFNAIEDASEQLEALEAYFENFA